MSVQAGEGACDICRRDLRHGEPTYPVRIEDGEVAVCVECAASLARDGIGAWPDRS